MMRLGYLNILVSLLFFATFITTVSAQQEFILKGAVMEKGTSNRVAAAQIVNKRTGLSVLSSDFGLFQIKALQGDTLFVIKMEYSDGIAVVPAGKDLVIYLDRGQTLREVNITGQTKKQELDDLKRDYKNKGSFYQGKPPLLSFLFKPLTAVYELFGRTPKNARRFGRYYETEMQQTSIDGLFNEFIIQNNTDLKGEALEKFMLDYRPEYEKAKSWTEYDAVKYIRESYKKYTDTLKK